jgi:quercetin dioxygenase-like cupin family protein
MDEQSEITVYPKIWGEEHWIVNKEYCGKKLVLKKGFRCSIHYHKLKDETFYVIKGKVLMETDGRMRLLTPGDKQYIAPGVKHRFSGLQDSELIEFSTHHREDDSYREMESGKIPVEEFKGLLKKYSA